jgi:hypothetical protein
MTAYPSARRWSARAVLILNASYEPLHVVSVTKSITMLHRGVAVIEEADPGRAFGPYPTPRVLRLTRYVHVKRAPLAWSRVRVLARDGSQCAYCGNRASTVDHIIPRSRGGHPTSYLNTVACCGRCNNRKGSKTPEEAGMQLRYAPYEPSLADLFQVQLSVPAGSERLAPESVTAPSFVTCAA